ncbi:DUF1249 domain-containing protein [Ferrimonas balearica]|uniref:DUF1249 domain-containing protein n=1 Tax=Ferrimonas balearica TaxID=44012 RepID=UPI001C997060|nr:DUF1249 domain-containing protein [Ferrimonas balearica]MBY5993725.1 DUF1249 domain-containing protein [Ferrimonas balearica]
MSSRRYVPNLNRFLALCGRNYVTLQRLINRARRHQGQGPYLWRHIDHNLDLTIRILEQTPYTDLLELERHSAPIPHVTVPKMTIRLYHDARLAEVLSSQQISRLMAVYEYPNDKMLQRNEKFQVNLFLAELLAQFNQRDWLTVSQSEESRKT